MALAVSARIPATDDDRLIERDRELGALATHAAAIADGDGRMVIVRGEAGIGKTALVRAFLSMIDESTPVFAGACDGVSTPRPFGPLYDMVPALGAELGELLAAGAARHDVARWLEARLKDRPPHVLVIEDIGWADEGTLDLMVHLSRRLAGLRTLVLVTCRDAEPARSGVEQVLGILAATPSVHQLALEPLSATGVAELAAGNTIDARELYRLTAGNPYFVVEVLASDGVRLPISVRDAVRARVGRLSDRARRALSCAAVIGARSEPWLVAAVAGEDVLGIDECLAAGLLVKRAGITFRHELTRVTVLDDLPVIQGIGIHRRALEALLRVGTADAARLAYHAEGAADAAAVRVHAVAAGDAAIAARSNHEGAAQYARVIRFLDGLSQRDRATLLERAAEAFFTVNQLDDATAARKEAAQIREELGDERGAGDNFRHLAYLTWVRGDGTTAWELAERAASTLEPLGPSRELAMAWSMLGALAMIAHRYEESRAWSHRALELGRALGDAEAIAHALNNIGIASDQGDWREDALPKLLESRTIAEVAGLPWHVHRALYNLAGLCVEQRDLAAAEAYYSELIEYSSAAQVERCSIEVQLATIRFELGRWDEAKRLATTSMGSARLESVDHALALVILGRLRALRGEPGADDLFDEAERMSRGVHDLERREMIAVGRAEAAWLRGTIPDRVIDELDGVYRHALDLGARWAIGGIGRWLWRAGVLADVDPAAPLPYRLEAAGEARGAAAEWDRLAIPLEAALCLAGSADAGDLAEAHERLVALGASAATRLVAERLHGAGGSVPRGPRRSTRQHPAGLTPRQAEVAALVAAGLSNRQIAERLVLTEKTAGHHVSAVLAKLEATRRAEVAPRLAAIESPPSPNGAAAR
jgi:DNA-binding CsgD family transcriptional regulator/tetratricopeptide (TPR) repeat protein